MNIKLFNEKPQIIKLKNGLNIHYIHEKTKVNYAQMDIPFGSFNLKYEVDGEVYDITPGLAHFMEHQMFQMKEGDAFKKLSSLGVNANALTTFRQTSYTVNGIFNFMDALLYLIEVVETPYFTKTSIENEKKIIKEEIMMYDDDKDTITHQKLYEMMFYVHPMIHDILGTVDTIKNITKEELDRVYQHFYKSNERQLIILGDIDFEALKTKLYEKDYLREDIKVLPLKFKEPDQVKVQSDEIFIDVTMPQLLMGIKYNLSKDDEVSLFKAEIAILFLMQMLYGNQSSFAEEMVKQGFINDSFNMNVTMEDETMIFVIDNQTEDPKSLSDKMLNYYFEEGLKSLEQKTFDTLKRAYLGSYIMALDDIENRIYLYGKYHMNGLSLEDAIYYLNNLALDDILSLYHAINMEFISKLYVYPKI